MLTRLPTTKMGAQAASTLRKALLLAVFPATQVFAQQQPLNEAATEAQAANNQAAAAAQEGINQTVDQANELNNQYAQALAELDSLNKYNEQLQGQVDAQEAEIASIQTQLTEIETTTREVLPLMERMVTTLEQFVQADIPFYLEERVERVNLLKDLLPRADVTISEKYRRILEAYQIELDYGRALETYQGPLGQGDDRTVQFVKLGRVSLMYQTLDRSETGYWNAQNKAWVVDNNYADNVAAALAVARGDGAPDLLRVPVPAPQAAN